MKQLSYFKERAILIPTLENVDVINEYMTSITLGEEKIYLSSDCKANVNINNMDDFYITEFLNSIKLFGMPNHEL